MKARRAAVLILVLWAVAMLALLAGGLSFVLRQDQAISNLERDRVAAHWAARAGVERSIAMLMDDGKALDDYHDKWADNEQQFKGVNIGSGLFNVTRDGFEPQPLEWYGINDECAKLNVNTATREQLMRLPHMTPAVAAAILDWRDADEKPEPDGIERGYYESLPHPYTIRNGRLRSVRELLLVRGVTPELFWGEDTNGNGRLDLNENDGPASDPPDNADGLLERGWYAYLTVFSYEKNVDATGQKRVNIKSADANTMASRLGLEQWAAESIVKARGQSEFKHLVDLLKVSRDPSVDRGNSANDTNARGESERDRPVTEEIFRRIADSITLSDEEIVGGRVNLNTAPREVLAALAGQEIADAIIRRRDSNQPFESIGDLLAVSGVNRDKFGEMETSVGVRSNVFQIRSQGVSATELAQATIECVIDRNEKTPKVLYWLETVP